MRLPEKYKAGMHHIANAPIFPDQNRDQPAGARVGQTQQATGPLFQAAGRLFGFEYGMTRHIASLGNSCIENIENGKIGSTKVFNGRCPVGYQCQTGAVKGIIHKR